MFAITQPYFIENTKDLSNIKRAVITIAGARRKYVPYCLPKPSSCYNRIYSDKFFNAVGGNIAMVGESHMTQR